MRARGETTQQRLLLPVLLARAVDVVKSQRNLSSRAAAIAELVREHPEVQAALHGLVL